MVDPTASGLQGVFGSTGSHGPILLYTHACSQQYLSQSRSVSSQCMLLSPVPFRSFLVPHPVFELSPQLSDQSEYLQTGGGETYGFGSLHGTLQFVILFGHASEEPQCASFLWTPVLVPVPEESALHGIPGVTLHSPVSSY